MSTSDEYWKKRKAANAIIEEAKCMARQEDYKSAKSKIEEAIQLCPSVKYGKEMVTVCEILHFYKHLAYPKETWFSQVLHIPTSSTESDIQSRYRNIMTDIKYLQGRFPNVKFADKFLRGAMSAHEKPSSSNSCGKRKFVLLDDSGDDADDDRGGDDDNATDDIASAAARSPEIKKLGEHIFTELPQKPHFSPFEKFCPSVRQGVKLVFDKVFVKLTQKLQKLHGDQILSNEEEDAMRWELSDLEDMGYDVMKLRERFDLLVRVKTMSKEDGSYEEKRKNLDGQISAEMVQFENVQSRMSKLRSEREVVEAQHHRFKSEMASLKSKLGKGDLCNMVKMKVED